MWKRIGLQEGKQDVSLLQNGDKSTMCTHRPSQQTHNVASTLLQRRCNVVTLQRVVTTLCVCWAYNRHIKMYQLVSRLPHASILFLELIRSIASLKGSKMIVKLNQSPYFRCSRRIDLSNRNFVNINCNHNKVINTLNK